MVREVVGADAVRYRSFIGKSSSRLERIRAVASRSSVPFEQRSAPVGHLAGEHPLQHGSRPEPTP